MRYDAVMMILLVIVVASVLASFTDWLFMDALVHRFYASEPGVWRARGGVARIVGSQAIGTVATAALVLLCVWAPGRALCVAAVAWVAGPLPVILQNLQWMRLHPVVAASHAAGWLVRFLIAGLLASWLLAH
jgi:hypothetical protein